MLDYYIQNHYSSGMNNDSGYSNAGLFVGKDTFIYNKFVVSYELF